MNPWAIILVLNNLFLVTRQDCVWYGECNEENGRIQNCPAKDPEPLPFKDEAKSFKILKEYCPRFLQEHSGKKFCCNDKQLETMARSINYAAGVFARCPTCLSNLNQHICLMTCSPNQTRFLEVVKIDVNNANVTYISEVNFYVTKKYLEKTFNSCKETSVPSTGGKAIDVSCGIWGATKQCTAEKWFSFFGNYKENLVAPFYVNYISENRGKFQMADINVLPCNESYESLRACSCSDCEASCTIPFHFTSPAGPFLIGNMNGVTVIMIILFCGFGGSIAVFIKRYHFKKSDGSRNVANDGVKDKKSFVVSLGNNLTRFLQNIFNKWGILCSRNPTLVLAFSSWIIAILVYGANNLQITTDPIEIWASPNCQTRREKTYFDTRFAPFFRTNQIFIKSKGLNSFNWTSPTGVKLHFGPAFNFRFLEEVYNLQMSIKELGENKGISLKKICFAPMKNEFQNVDSGEYCAVQSVWGYLQNDIQSCRNSTDYMYDQLQKCLRNNYDPSCLAPYGGPIFSPLAVGGYEQNKGSGIQEQDYLLATGVTLTFLLNNAANKTHLDDALLWESWFINFLKNWSSTNKPEFMEIAFAAERSIQDEIERESKAEMTTIIISYFVMFIYITVSLGRIRGFSSLLSESKFTLSFGGIIIVLASVFASFGVFGYLGVATTLLTIEVIPFLILAVGVDNIFILVHYYQDIQSKSKGSIEENIGQTLGKMGPSILLTSSSEAACFLIGTLSNMPAVKTFAQYSSLAIVLNFILQISCFISILALDSKRQERNYADIFCCVKMKKVQVEYKNTNFLYLILKNSYAPFLMKSWVRLLVILVFLFWLCASIACIPHIQKGLDQEMSMPEDSYLIDYFQYMNDLLSVGPPVYFVIKSGLNFTKPEEVNAICGSVGCDSDSLVTYLTRASKLSNFSYLAKSPSSWIDDYFDWILNSKECCRQFKENGSFCPHNVKECQSCVIDVVDWRPKAVDFKKYLPYFLNDNPDLTCSKAGHALYAGGVNYEMGMLGDLQVRDNYFMTYHTPLKTSYDFYMALDSARRIATHLSTALTTKLKRTIEVFPYSLFYIFYEQYLTIVEEVLLSLSLSLLAMFGVTFLFTGFDLKSSIVVCLMVASIVTDMSGMLYWWNITLNAISLVNLIVSVGIGVEFCTHIMNAFRLSTEPDGVSKAKYAISEIGISIFSGITLTKFLGIIVLAFAQTLLLRTFYFKMYLGVILVGVMHGLVLMPVILSYLD